MMKVSKRDIDSALQYLITHCSLSLVPYEDTKKDWAQAQDEIKKSFGLALKKGKYKSVSLSSLKKTPLYDHGRRPSQFLHNPIVIATLKGKKIVIDGNHRVITAIINKGKTLDALVIPLDPKLFSSLLDLEGNF